MTKITNFTNQSTKDYRNMLAEMRNDLEAFEEKYGVTISFGNGRYTAEQLNVKLNITVAQTSADGSTASARDAEYIAAWKDREIIRLQHGIDDTALGTMVPVHMRGPLGRTKGELIGMKKGARKNHYILKLSNGQFTRVDHVAIKAAM